MMTLGSRKPRPNQCQISHSQAMPVANMDSLISDSVESRSTCYHSSLKLWLIMVVFLYLRNLCNNYDGWFSRCLLNFSTLYFHIKQAKVRLIPFNLCADLNHLPLCNLLNVFSGFLRITLTFTVIFLTLRPGQLPAKCCTQEKGNRKYIV